MSIFQISLESLLIINHGKPLRERSTEVVNSSRILIGLGRKENNIITPNGITFISDYSNLSCKNYVCEFCLYKNMETCANHKFHLLAVINYEFYF